MTNTPPRTLAVFVDGSVYADDAFHRALRIKEPDDHLHVVHIIEFIEPLSFAGVKPALVPGSTFRGANIQLKEHGREVAQKFADYLEKHKILNTTTTLLGSHDTVQSAIEMISDKHVDLLFVGSRGRGAMKQFFLGSFCNAMVNNAPCDVVVVKHNDDRVQEENEVVVGKTMEEKEVIAPQKNLNAPAVPITQAAEMPPQQNVAHFAGPDIGYVRNSRLTTVDSEIIIGVTGDGSNDVNGRRTSPTATVNVDVTVGSEAAEADENDSLF